MAEGKVFWERFLELLIAIGKDRVSYGYSSEVRSNHDHRTHRHWLEYAGITIADEYLFSLE